jgi:hypothetical protein
MEKQRPTILRSRSIPASPDEDTGVCQLADQVLLGQDLIFCSLIMELELLELTMMQSSFPVFALGLAASSGRRQF